MADNKPTQPAPPPLRWVRAENYAEVYANNVRFESSVWDLKAVFGTLDQGTPDSAMYPATVKFHTAVTTPWAQVKLALYSLYLNVMFHENAEGTVSVSKIVVPPPVAELVPEMANTEAGRAMIERDAKLRADLFGE
jgi:hypothetical protein